MYLDKAMSTVKSGYEHLKIVARGEAVPMAQELLQQLKLKTKYC